MKRILFSLIAILSVFVSSSCQKIIFSTVGPEIAFIRIEDEDSKFIKNAKFSVSFLEADLSDLEISEFETEFTDQNCRLKCYRLISSQFCKLASNCAAEGTLKGSVIRITVSADEYQSETVEIISDGVTYPKEIVTLRKTD